MSIKANQNKTDKYRVELMSRSPKRDSDHQCFAFMVDLLVDPRSGQPELHELPPDDNKRNGR